jgi:hypothetical protein
LGGFAMMAGVAIGQPLTSGALQIQIPVTAMGGYSLSSANSDQETPLAPSPVNEYRPYSSTSAVASVMNPLSLGRLKMPNHTDFIVQTWSSPVNNTPAQTSFSNNTSPLMSSNNTSPEYSSSDTFSPEILHLDTIPLRPSIPARHPAHTLSASILPFVSSAIPNFQEVDAEPIADDNLWEACQQLWLQFERPSTPRLKWNRLLHKPRSMIGRKLAGKWEDEDDSKGKSEDDPKSIKSVKTAPSILC